MASTSLKSFKFRFKFKFLNGKNVLDEFRTGLKQTVEKMCSTQIINKFKSENRVII